MPIIPTGTARFNLRMHLDGDPEDMLVTFACSITENVDFNMCSDIASVWDEALKDITPGEYTLKSVDGVDSEGGQAIAAANITGTSTGTGLPQNCALLVRKFTGQAGRKNRGRLFYPGVQKEAVDDKGFLDSGSLSVYQENFSDFLSGLEGIDGISKMVILHEDASTPTDVVFLAVEPQIGTQRRRMRP